MIRDRLEELQKARDGQDGELCLSMEVSAEQASMNLFFSQIEEVLEEIRKVEEIIPQVRKKHSEIIVSQKEPELKKELDDLTAALKRSSAKANLKLKQLVPKPVDENERQSADFRIRKTQHGAVTRRFVEVMTQYQHLQEEYRDRCKDRIHRQLRIIGKDPTEEELDEMLEQENPEVFTQAIKQEEKAKEQLAEIQDRHQEIMKLESSLQELHDLFVEISVMILSQGEMVDNIAAHVTSTQEYVERAREATGAALEFQGKARKKKLILALILLVVVGIVAIIIAVSVS